ncbi:hypothetical protein AZI86_01345 [Bdellovibrio bacteriovorus]|uniref:Uncharacterized protein n=1 Tax=Bdellovibrio bacteriovorus TaxID=959 RepID=A0A150WN77_BDEBC|nr:hypothetical protein [Bdellovibrio bacteriovorus]KYG65749.1 hypothetical protein AZI86_01345 [Bdellovibrio bacteriovorus]
MRALKLFSLLGLILVAGLQTSDAFTRRVNIDGESQSTGDALQSPSRFVPPNDIGMRMAKSASAGVGYSAGKNYCYRSVKFIIADAMGKNRECVKSHMSQISAKDGGSDLLKVGFVLDNSKCETPGAVRIYKGVLRRGYSASKGDIHGHSEVVGDDGMYHHFMSTSTPANVYNAGRRILTGCYYPDFDKISQGPIGSCPSVGYKPIRVKKKQQSGVD